MSDTSTSEAIATITRNDLASALTFASLGLPRRPVVPVLAGMVVTITPAGVELAAFDYEVAAIAAQPCETAGTAAILVTGRALADAVKSLPKGRKVTADLIIEGGKLTMDCDGTSAVLSSLPIEEYPALPELPALSGVMDGEAFARTARRVSVCAGADETLPVLMHVLMTSDHGEIEFAATDRYRLAVDRQAWTGPDGLNVLVSGKTLHDAARKLDAHGKISMHLSKERAGFSDGQHTLITAVYGRKRGYQAEFPKYRKLIPDLASAPTVVTVDAPALEAALVRAGKMGERNGRTGFAVHSDGITITAMADGEAVSSQTVPAGITGDEMESGFNAGYLASVLSGIDGTALVGLVSPTKPVTVRSDDGFTGVCMPIRRP